MPRSCPRSESGFLPGLYRAGGRSLLHRRQRLRQQHYDPRTLGVGSSTPADITVYNGEVYFTAFTPATARAVEIEHRGLARAGGRHRSDRLLGPAELTVFNNELYFAATTPANGREIWKLDATGTATLVVDVFTDGSSAANGLTVYNNALYFAAFTTATAASCGKQRRVAWRPRWLISTPSARPIRPTDGLQQRAVFQRFDAGDGPRIVESRYRRRRR